MLRRTRLLGAGLAIAAIVLAYLSGPGQVLSWHTPVQSDGRFRSHIETSPPAKRQDPAGNQRRLRFSSPSGNQNTGNGVGFGIEWDEEQYGPFAAGEQAADMTDAALKLGWPIIGPNHALANPANIEKIWVERLSDLGGQVAIYYTSGIMVEESLWRIAAPPEEQPTATETAREAYQEFADDWNNTPPLDATVPVTDLLIPALGETAPLVEFPPDSTNTKPGRAAIELAVANHDITIYGHVSIPTLKGIALSLN